MDETSVRVALRIRPQIAREKIEMCRVCTSVTPGEPQVSLGGDRAFTFDHVFDIDAEQQTIYGTCIEQLLDGCFDGYNATVLAYGQTGSGKTHTMGTGFDMIQTPETLGIIPRAVDHLFRGIQERKQLAIDAGLPEPVFQISVQFIELYNEEVLDLLDTSRDLELGRSSKSNIRIHEDNCGGIYVTGVENRTITTVDETLKALQNGALSRTTASTNMNVQSSRSHAVFTINIRQQRVIKQENEDTSSGESREFETLTAKFHFVDLAGSERLKRTGATGDRAKEGISINCGLLALGNVISALGDVSRKASHVPYRDSKLTRLLQDSLGGNSRTLMIACISPSDCDFIETLNTLKYANRAKNIKNKVVANQDRSSRLISELRTRIQCLEAELLEYKQGKRMVTEDGGEAINDVYHENVLLQTEIGQLRVRVKALQETVETLQARNASILTEMESRSLAMNIKRSNNEENGEDEKNDALESAIRKYMEEIEEFRARLCESESSCEQLRRQLNRFKSMGHNNNVYDSPGFGMQLHSGQKTEFSAATRAASSACLQEMNGGNDNGVEDYAMSSSTTTLTDTAKSEIMKLKAKKKELAREYSTNGVSTAKNGSDGECTTSDNEDASDDSDNDESDTELVKNRQDLADLQCEISIKERLVEELEQSQRRLNAVRLHYEEKMSQLQLRIHDIEMERDRVLSVLENRQKHQTEDSGANAAKVRKEYEEKISTLRNEMKRLEGARREHQRLLREQQHNQQQVHKLGNELREMKKAKVTLVQKMKEDAEKIRSIELKRTKEMAQWQKEARKRENEIRDLKLKEQRREAVLRRKQEEVQALRRQQRPVSGRPVNGISTGNGVTGNGNTNGVGGSQVSRRRPLHFSAKVAKQHWNNIEKTISNLVTKKQAVSQMEQELERLMQKRDEKRQKLEHLHRKKTALTNGSSVVPVDGNAVADVDDQIESMQANMDYFQDQISECQKQIIDVEDSKEESESQELQSVFQQCTNLDEAKYLLERLYGFCVAQGTLAAQKQASLKEVEVKCHQLQQDFQLHQKLLQHMISNNPEMLGLSENMVTSVESLKSEVFTTSNAFDRVGQALSDEKSDDGAGFCSERFRGKARRRTATPEELLYSESGNGVATHNNDARALNVVFELNGTDEENGSRTRDCSPASDDRDSAVNGKKDGCVKQLSSKAPASVKSDSSLMPPPPVPPKKVSLLNNPVANQQSYDTTSNARMIVNDVSVPLRRQANNKDTDRYSMNAVEQPSNFTRGLPARSTIAGCQANESSVSRKLYGFRQSISKLPPLDTRSAQPVVIAASCTNSTLSSSMTSSTVSNSSLTTPPVSPRVLRRQLGNKNVFSRLSASTIPALDEAVGESEPQSQGIITIYSGPRQSFRNNLLTCTRIAQGHSKAVLTVVATDRLMATGSKDRTARLWDLEKNTEILAFGDHVNNVQCVRLNSNENMLFTVTMGHVKLWDLRSQVCIKVLSSSGQSYDRELSPNSGDAVPARHMGYGVNESFICQVEMTPNESHLLTAAYNQIRTWDLRMYSSIGKLANPTSTPKSEISSLSIVPLRSNGFRAAVGSRDHYVKIFDVNTAPVGNFESHMQLDPPHYDGVTCLEYCENGRQLFSGSRDQSLMKWDIDNGGRRLQQVTNAHRAWILSLRLLPPPFQSLLVSSCREGFLRCWDTKSCANLGEIRAHSSAIYNLTTNSDYLFTASHDGNVGIWKPRDDLLSSLNVSRI